MPRPKGSKNKAKPTTTQTDFTTLVADIAALAKYQRGTENQEGGTGKRTAEVNGRWRALCQ